MKYQIWSGLSAALVTAVVSTAASAAEVNSAAAAKPQPEATTPVQTAKQPQSAFIIEAAGIAKVLPHEWEGYKAATLYVRNIPVLTFLGDRPSQQTKTANAANKSEPLDPVAKATAAAAKINQLDKDKADANAIAVVWQPDSNSYAIKFQTSVLAIVDGKTILPDTTRNQAQDALQAANRLRRLLGKAAPLEQIPNKPAPKRSAVTKTAAVTNLEVRYQLKGIASWYGADQDGGITATGERVDESALTAAHRTLPFGTKVRVTNLNNGRSVVVRINDRGPFIAGRVIDLSIAAAKAIDMYGSGIAPVQLDVLGAAASTAANPE